MAAAVDFLTTSPATQRGERRHYIDHMLPVWEALPRDRRGDWVISQDMAEYARSRGIKPKIARNYDDAIRVLRENPGRPVVVSGHADTNQPDKAGRKNIILYHGVGFVFDKRHKLRSYPGTNRGRANTLAIIAPSKRIAAVEKKGNPNIPVPVIGCPKLDKWHLKPKKRRRGKPTVALAWHWDCRVAAETRTAFYEFYPGFAGLLEEYNVIGHGHPHIIDRLEPAYEALKIPVVRDLEDVFAKADVMVADATSAMYEFASLDRPIVICESAKYRPVSYGGFFGERHRLGVVCRKPADLKAAIAEALADPPEIAESRRKLVQEAYTYTDGKCAERAAAAIIEIVDALEPHTTPEPDVAAAEIRHPVDSAKVSVIIAFRGDSGGPRDKAYEVVLQRWQAMFPGFEICVGEDDSGAADFCKARALNNAVQAASGEVLIVTDADVVWDKATVEHGLAALNGAAWVQPYRECERLDKPSTEAWLKDCSGEAVSRDYKTAYSPCLACGPMTIIRRADWEQIGGYDEAFTGWGCEDGAWGIAADGIIGKRTKLNDKVYHLWHDDYGGPRRSRATWLRNRQRLRLYQKATNNSEALRGLIRHDEGLREKAEKPDNPALRPRSRYLAKHPIRGRRR